MIVGHFAVGLAAKKFTPRTSLGLLFLAVQFLDLLWAPAVLLGFEHARLVPGYLPASPFYFADFPWTHGLLMTIAWSWLFFRLTKNAILGACVFSHWVLDWVSHTRDLPLYKGGPLVGLGLWHFRHATFLVETALLLVGLLIYLQVTRPRTPAGNYAVTGLVVGLILVDAFELYGPVFSTIQVALVAAEAGCLLAVGLAFVADRTREPLPPEPQIRLNIAETSS